MTPRLAVPLVAAALALPAAAAGQGTSTLEAPFAFNGPIGAIAQAGNVTWVGGSFSAGSPSANVAEGFMEVTATGTPRVAFPSIARSVMSCCLGPIADDGAGGWFTAEIGELIHFRADGTADPAISVTVQGSIATIQTLVREGGVLYLGGTFTDVNGVPRRSAAAIDVATGALLPWNPDIVISPAFAGSVATLLPTAGRVFLGGSFSHVGGSPRASFAAVDATTGALDPFVANVDAAGQVRAMQVVGSTLFLGGLFTQVNGFPRQNLAAVNLANGSNLGISLAANGLVTRMVTNGAAVYFSGDFLTVNGLDRRRLAAVEAATLLLLGWNPALTEGVPHALAVQGNEVYIGGSFSAIGGLPRANAAAVPATGTGVPPLPWNPGPDDVVTGIAVSSSGTIAMKGNFRHYGAIPAGRLAAFNHVTGEWLSAPRLSPGFASFALSVEALAVAGRTLYLGGSFSAVNGEPRSNLAAIDLHTGMVLPFAPSPEPTAEVFALAVSGGTVFAGGAFSTVNGVSRPRLAAVDAVTGSLLPWDPAPGGVVNTVRDLEADATTLYVGGAFTTMAGQPRVSLAAFDLATLALTSFNPGAPSGVEALVRHGTVLYAGGGFGAIAIDVSSGLLTPFAPQVNGVFDLAAAEDAVYLGGIFSSVNGVPRQGAAAVDPATGLTLPLDLGLDASTFARTVAALPGAAMFATSGGSVARNRLSIALSPGMSGSPGPPSTPRPRMTGSTLSMTWSRSAIGGPPIDYLVEAALSPGGAIVGAISNGSATPTFTFAGVPPGQYFLRVRARNAFGVSLPSPEVGVVVGSPICAPPAETVLQPTVTGSNVVLQWTQPTGFGSAYTLHVGSAPGRSDVLVFNAGGGNSISGAGPPGAFFARVIASGPCGVAAATPDGLISIGGVAPPDVPLAIARVAGSSVTIDWTAVANAVRYVVEAGTGPLLTDIASIDATVPGLAGSGVPPGNYYVRVKAVAANGLTSTSRELVIIVH